MEEKTEEENKIIEKKPRIRGLKTVGILAGLLFGILFVSMVYEYYNSINVALNTPQAVYTFITNNYNGTIVNITNPDYKSLIRTVNTNTTLAGAPTNTTIYYLGAEFCPYCAVESYNLWYMLTNGKPFPALDSNFYTAEANIPAIPINYIQDNQTYPINFVPFEIPVTAQELSNIQQAQADFTSAIKSLSPFQQSLFSSENFSIPQIYVVKPLGNNTYSICQAYVGIPFMVYNQSTAQYLIGQFNTKGLAFNDVIPNPVAININLNTLNYCINEEAS